MKRTEKQMARAFKKLREVLIILGNEADALTEECSYPLGVRELNYMHDRIYDIVEDYGHMEPAEPRKKRLPRK